MKNKYNKIREKDNPYKIYKIWDNNKLYILKKYKPEESQGTFIHYQNSSGNAIHIQG